MQKLYHSPELTILNVVWAPYMTIYPHNHRMWAVIGVYTGREDNIFWKRNGNKVEAAGAQALSERDAVPLGPDIIHSVTNPIPRLTGAIHVYGGDFFGVGAQRMGSGDAARRAATTRRRPCVTSSRRTPVVNQRQKKLSRYKALQSR